MKLTPFVETLYNMYPTKINKDKLDSYLNKRILTKEEYEYILAKEEK